MPLEYREFAGLEIREADTKKFPGSIGTLNGYAAKFNNLSKPIKQGTVTFRERILPGAFTRSLTVQDDFHDVRALVGHDKNRLLGRQSAQTLETREDSTGLAVRIHLVDTTDCRDTLTNVKCGNLGAMSFGFLPNKTKTLKDDAGLIRELVDVDLAEVSVVGIGQYPHTEISARELQEMETVARIAPPDNLSILHLRRRFSQLQLRYGELSVDAVRPSYTSTAEKATQASYAAAELTRKARSGDKDDQAAAAKAHKLAAALHCQACEEAPGHHEAIANEHKALASMHNKAANN